RGAGQVALLVFGIVLVRQGEEEHRHHPQEDQKDHHGEDFIALFQFVHSRSLLRTGNTGRDCNCRSPGWRCTAAAPPGTGPPLPEASSACPGPFPTTSWPGGWRR